MGKEGVTPVLTPGPPQFFAEVREAEEMLRKTEEMMRRKFSCDRGTTATRLEDLLQDLAVRAPPRPPGRLPDPGGIPRVTPRPWGFLPRVTLLCGLVTRASGSPGELPKWTLPRSSE